MDWLDMMRNAIEYIEDNIEGDISYDEISRIACSSTFHFQRMFHMITGMTIADYMRRRRLTLAAQELTMSKAKVIDIALKYGYDSPESFTKAFKKAHGITPTDARKQGVNLKAFPRISFHISLKGDKDMDYRIIDKGSFNVVGKSIPVTTKFGENLKIIPKFWNDCCNDGTCNRICALNEKSDMYGICMDCDNAKEEFTYMIAVDDVKGTKDEDFVTREIPAATWAIFTSIGPMPSAIQKVWERIFQEWFPATGYEHADAPELEVYPSGDSSTEDYRCEVWIPIIKK